MTDKQFTKEDWEKLQESIEPVSLNPGSVRPVDEGEREDNINKREILKPSVYDRGPRRPDEQFYFTAAPVYASLGIDHAFHLDFLDSPEGANAKMTAVLLEYPIVATEGWENVLESVDMAHGPAFTAFMRSCSFVVPSNDTQFVFTVERHSVMLHDSFEQPYTLNVFAPVGKGNVLVPAARDNVTHFTISKVEDFYGAAYRRTGVC